MPVDPKRRGFQYLPFSNAPPALLNYFIYLITITAFAIATFAQERSFRTFAIHAILSFVAVLAFNFFLHCMLYGNCMRSALIVVSALQIAHIVWFLRNAK